MVFFHSTRYALNSICYAYFFLEFISKSCGFEFHELLKLSHVFPCWILKYSDYVILILAM